MATDRSIKRHVNIQTLALETNLHMFRKYDSQKNSCSDLFRKFKDRQIRIKLKRAMNHIHRTITCLRYNKQLNIVLTETWNTRWKGIQDRRKSMNSDYQIKYV